MRAVQLPSPVTDPKHMCRTIVPITSQTVLPGHRFLIPEQQSLVTSIELRFSNLRYCIGSQATGRHEGQAFVNSVRKLRVLRTLWAVGYEIHIPTVNLVQIGKTALSERA